MRALGMFGYDMLEVIGSEQLKKVSGQGQFPMSMSLWQSQKELGDVNQDASNPAKLSLFRHPAHCLLGYWSLRVCCSNLLPQSKPEQSVSTNDWLRSSCCSVLSAKKTKRNRYSVGDGSSTGLVAGLWLKCCSTKFLGNCPIGHLPCLVSRTQLNHPQVANTLASLETG